MYKKEIKQKLGSLHNQLQHCCSKTLVLETKVERIKENIFFVEETKEELLEQIRIELEYQDWILDEIKRIENDTYNIV